ncbi:Protein kinase domain-containing protein [Fusarium keratoplasticum]|uniref:Protein kinase domain-containing protein n=1 Tax=Fusarium keratoplasticum TaxID=1328300 RepID=A0ACC0QGT3_9HYPO|nr:Protein kinase domain-containing protein [Fusarium keratoplasticum]KAI8652545.1 Protein kinase domain-containing protein [Fusarium keratoplasticum]
MDDSLPDLVRDWELETKLVSEKQTIHTTYVSDPARGRWRRAEEEVWDQKTMLGRGSFGVVSLQKCTSGPNSGRLRAAKEIQVTLDGSLDKFLSREISAIVKFSHKRFRECFVPSFGWYRGKDSIFITMEYLPLGDLQSYLDNPLPDREARTITEQILQGIDFMHRSKFAHRDLKPKNILVQHKGPNWWVKISDFGCSKQSESTSLRTIIGTEPYLAPELQNIFAPSDESDLEDEEDLDSSEYPVYSLAIDIWALGAITFRIAAGQVPFPSPIGKRLSRYVAHGGKFPSNELLSIECRDFIVAAMSRSPRDRPSAAAALKNPWIVSRCATEVVESDTDAGIDLNSYTNLETRPERSQTTLDEASGSWTTIRQSLAVRPKPLPSHLKSTERTLTELPEADEASGSWSTVQRDPVEGGPNGSTAPRRPELQEPPIPQLSPVKLTFATEDRHYFTPNGRVIETRRVPFVCAFSVDGRWLFSASKASLSQSIFHLWRQTDQGGFTQINPQVTDCDSILGVAVSSNGRRLISHHSNMDEDSYVRSWKFAKSLDYCQSKSKFGAYGAPYTTTWGISANTRRVFGAKHARSGPSAIITLELDSNDNFTILRSQKLNFTVNKIIPSADGENYVAFHTDKCTIFSYPDATGSQFDLWSPMRRGELGWHVAKRAAEFSLDGQWCIIWYNQILRIFRRTTLGWKSRQEVKFDAQALAFSANSKRFAMGSPDGTIFIWRLDGNDYFVKDGELQLSTQSGLHYLTFSPNGQFLATTAMGKFEVWKIF